MTVASVQADVMTFASTALANAKDYIDRLGAQKFDSPSVKVPDPTETYINPELLWDALFRLTANLPPGVNIGAYNFDAIPKPVAPTIGAFSPPTVVNIPDFGILPPVLTTINAPNNPMPADPGNAPTLNSPNTPAPPLYSLPAVPVFTPVTVPGPQNVAIPVFNAELPIDELTLRTNEFSFAENIYATAMLDRVKAKLLLDLANGGYGIETADEERLWERMRERELVDAEAQIEELMRQAGARGFNLPPGVALVRMDDVRQKANEKISSASREIAIKRADMYVENRKFTMQQASEVEKIYIDYYSSIAERALNAARAQVELGVALFNARVGRFNAQLQAFSAAAQVFEVEVRAALASVEIYKSQIEAAQVTADIQKIYVDVYRSQLEGVKTLADIYNTEVSAARVLAEIERLKLESFKTQVEAYTARVGARTAEFQMYEAQLRGEGLKVQNYSAQVSAYGSQVEAYKTRSSAELAVSQVQIAQAESQLSKYRTDLEAYKTNIARVNSQLEGAIREHGVLVGGYAANAQAVGKYYDLAIALQNYNSNIYNEQSRAAIQKAQVELTNITNLQGLTQASLVKGADLYTTQAQAALNSINALAAEIVQT